MPNDIIVLISNLYKHNVYLTAQWKQCEAVAVQILLYYGEGVVLLFPVPQTHVVMVSIYKYPHEISRGIQLERAMEVADRRYEAWRAVFCVYVCIYGGRRSNVQVLLRLVWT